MPTPFPTYHPAQPANIFRKRCPSNAVLDMIADKWSALMVSKLQGGSQRHGELLSSIEGLSQRMLTQTLRDLERHGLISCTVHPVVPPHVDYALTSLGQGLYNEVLRPMTCWAMEHMGEVAQQRIDFEQRENIERA